MHRIGSQRGFSLIELMITIAILGILMAFAIPSMTTLIRGARVKAASEFYVAGFRKARQEAIKHNSNSRLVLIENSISGQFDWRVDICFRSPLNACDDMSAGWSTPTAKASDDPETVNPYRSKLSSSDSLLKASIMDNEQDPPGADAVYFISTGWVDTNVAPNLRQLTLKPATGTSDFRPTAVSLTLAGIVSSCLPELPATSRDSRRCPP